MSRFTLEYRLEYGPKTVMYLQSCPNIEDLNLNKCKKITDQTCQALGRRCSKLQR